jgi:hypothetical protein
MLWVSWSNEDWFGASNLLDLQPATKIVWVTITIT